MSTIRYRTSLKIPKSGVYRVFHREHDLPEEVTLLENGIFPGCTQCNKLIHFQFVRKVEIDPEGFHVTLHQIPPVSAAHTAANDHRKKAA